jgi:hypothetical protein
MGWADWRGLVMLEELFTCLSRIFASDSKESNIHVGLDCESNIHVGLDYLV